MSTKGESNETVPTPAVGLDLGSQKTMIVADDGEIIRTDTGKRNNQIML